MRNHNVYEVNDDVEKKIKNGDYRGIIKFPGVNIAIDKMVFDDTSAIPATEEYPIDETLIKLRSPFRIGVQKISLIKLSENIFQRNNKSWSFDKAEFTKSINLITRKHKNCVMALPICGALNEYRSDIIKILEDNVRDTKVVITEK